MTVAQPMLGSYPLCEGDRDVCEQTSCCSKSGFPDDASTTASEDGASSIGGGLQSPASSLLMSEAASDGASEHDPATGGETATSRRRIEDDVADVEGLLEGMNTSAIEMNRLQGELTRLRQRRVQLDRHWALSSARLARAAGPERISRARALYEQQRRQHELQTRAQALSERYLRAREAGAGEGDLAKISEELARCLAKFQAPAASPTGAAAAAAASPRSPRTPRTPREDSAALALFGLEPYFEEEDEHRRRTAEAEAATAEVSRRFAAAKGRYQDALKALESISERVHDERRRSAGQVLLKAQSI